MKTTHLLIGFATLALLASCATTVQLSSSNSQRFQDGIYYTKPNTAANRVLREKEDAEVAALVSETATSGLFENNEEGQYTPEFASATLDFNTAPVTTVNIYTTTDLTWWTPYDLSFAWGYDPWYWTYNSRYYRYRPYYSWAGTRYYDYWYWRDRYYSPWYYASWYDPWYYGSWYDSWAWRGWFYDPWYSSYYYSGWYGPWHHHHHHYGGYYGGGHRDYWGPHTWGTRQARE